MAWSHWPVLMHRRSALACCAVRQLHVLLHNTFVLMLFCLGCCSTCSSRDDSQSTVYMHMVAPGSPSSSWWICWLHALVQKPGAGVVAIWPPFCEHVQVTPCVPCTRVVSSAARSSCALATQDRSAQHFDVRDCTCSSTVVAGECVGIVKRTTHHDFYTHSGLHSFCSSCTWLKNSVVCLVMRCARSEVLGGVCC